MGKLFSTTRNIFAVLGIFAFLAIVVGVLCFYFVVPAHDAAAEVETRQTVSEITKEWNINELQKYLASHFVVGLYASGANINSDNMADATKVFAQAKDILGAFKSVDRINCYQQRYNGFRMCRTWITTEKGDASITVESKNTDGQYKITNFSIF